MQVPPWQVSLVVQALASSQALPAALSGFEQTPVVESHVPTSWHWSLGVQMTGLPPVQVPLWQVSLVVQALASSQALPAALSGFEQTPVVESHVPASWHWSFGVQMTGSAPVQDPAWHVSARVQALPSSHGVPSTWSGLLHAPATGRTYTADCSAPGTRHRCRDRLCTARPARRRRCRRPLALPGRCRSPCGRRRGTPHRCRNRSRTARPVS